MKGEEFFGEVKEERLIDRDLSWLFFFGLVFALVESIYLYLHIVTVRIESFWTWSYWLEVMGFALVIGDLFFRERTEWLLALGKGYFTPGDANWVGWWKFAAFILIACLVLVEVLDFVILQDLLGTQEIFEIGVFAGLGYSIGYGPYFYVLGKTNDRVLGTGVGLALTGLTFATSAQITTTFF